MSSSDHSASRKAPDSPETPPTTPQLWAQIVMSIARIAKMTYSLTSTKYVRLPRLLQEFALARAEGRYLKLLNKLARLDPLVLDDWAMKKISGARQEDLHELLDDRMQTRSTVAASQIPIESWHEMMANPTLSDAILDRLVHIAHRIELKGESMRKQLAELSRPVHQYSPDHVNKKNG